MKKIKKILKLFLLIILIVLASIGIGMVGGVPLSLTNHRRDNEKETTELLEKKENQSDSKQAQYKG